MRIILYLQIIRTLQGHIYLHWSVRWSIAGEDVPDETGHDHTSGGAALAHLTVEHTGRVLIRASQLSQHCVKITFPGGFLINNWHSGKVLIVLLVTKESVCTLHS